MRIHFTGVAGAGMSAAALMMREAGHQVSGSDEDVFPPMSTYVEGLGFPFHRRFAAANLPAGLDVLVQGTSAKLGGEANPEIAEARARGVKVTSFPQMVGEATAGRDVTVVAGSFGKSTCTALLAHVLRSGGVDAGWMVGAISPSLPDTGHWGAARQVVLEGDEYVVSQTDRRSKFLLYQLSYPGSGRRGAGVYVGNRSGASRVESLQSSHSKKEPGVAAGLLKSVMVGCLQGRRRQDRLRWLSHG